uniref:Uncharacterized protein n=1 Tax=Salix viminalis TaxID=40686 RepID=A0A6N2M1I9_SALVM
MLFTTSRAFGRLHKDTLNQSCSKFAQPKTGFKLDYGCLTSVEWAHTQSKSMSAIRHSNERKRQPSHVDEFPAGTCHTRNNVPKANSHKARNLIGIDQGILLNQPKYSEIDYNVWKKSALPMFRQKVR